MVLPTIKGIIIRESFQNDCKKLQEKSGWDYNGNRKTFFEKTESGTSDVGVYYKFADGITAIETPGFVYLKLLPKTSVDSLEELYFNANFQFISVNITSKTYIYPIIDPVSIPSFSFSFSWTFFPVPVMY